MKKYVILSDGDKLRTIREKYKLKQEEISGGDITRNLISEIETNKAKMTQNTAEIIIKNLNKLASKRQFKVTETVSYLMENELLQANKILDDYIVELKNLSVCKDNSFSKILEECESFLSKWDIKDKKVVIYEMAGDYYNNQNEFYKSVVYYEKALEAVKKNSLNKTVLTLLRKISIVYMYMGKYDESIKNCNIGLMQFPNMPKDVAVIFMCIRALSYRKLNNFTSALSNLDEAEKNVDKTDVSTYIKILNNKANCLYETKKYNEALDIFINILNIVDKNDVEKYSIVLINIINTYIFLDVMDKVDEKFNILLEQLQNINDNSMYLPDIYFEIGKIYDRLKNLNEAEEYYLRALQFCKKQNNYILADDILCALMGIYKNTNNINKMDSIKENAFWLSSKQDKISDSLMYELIAFYSKHGDNNRTMEIANFALKFNKIGGVSC